MTEEHDENCVKSVETTENDDDESNREKPVQNGEQHVTLNDETSANTSKDSVIDSEIKEFKEETVEVKKVEVILKREISSEEAKQKNKTEVTPRLSWTQIGNEFKVTWSLPEGVATTQDYIALCCSGKS